MRALDRHRRGEEPGFRARAKGRTVLRTRMIKTGKGVLFLPNQADQISASEGGGTARYASRLIGERDVVRLARSSSRSSGATFGSDRDTEGHSEHHATELAVLAAEIEQLPDRAGRSEDCLAAGVDARCSFRSTICRRMPSRSGQYGYHHQSTMSAHL